jgi:peptide/nickel transport system ATP-binding protein
LKIEDLRIHYFTSSGDIIKAVDGVDLEIQQNESLAIVGESGCGKSTLAHGIFGMLPSNAKIVKGRIFFKGIDLTKSRKSLLREIWFKEISIIFQESMNMLNPVMNVEKQIADVIMLHNRKISKNEALHEARKLLELTGIPKDKGKDYPHQLSGGQKQRVCIAMAIALKPTLIIADEPFTALDIIVQNQLIELLNKLRQEIKSSLIFITHDINVVGELCEKIAVMYAGQIVEYGKLDKVLNLPAHPYTKMLFDAVPTINGDTTELKYIPGEPPNMINPPPGCRFHPRCPYTNLECKKKEPQLVKIEEEHYSACHLQKV